FANNRMAGREVQMPSHIGQSCQSEPQSHVLPYIQRFLASPAPFIAILFLGLAARLRHYLACPSYWYDEAYLLLNILHKSYADLIGPLEHDQAAPPFFLWLLRLVYSLFGSSEWAMRLPALSASVATVILMIFLARQLVGTTAWLWAVAFCAVSSHAVFHG